MKYITINLQGNTVARKVLTRYLNSGNYVQIFVSISKKKCPKRQSFKLNKFVEAEQQTLLGPRQLLEGLQSVLKPYQKLNRTNKPFRPGRTAGRFSTRKECFRPFEVSVSRIYQLQAKGTERLDKGFYKLLLFASALLGKKREVENSGEKRKNCFL